MQRGPVFFSGSEYFFCCVLCNISPRFLICVQQSETLFRSCSSDEDTSLPPLAAANQAAGPPPKPNRPPGSQSPAPPPIGAQSRCQVLQSTHGFQATSTASEAWRPCPPNMRRPRLSRESALSKATRPEKCGSANRRCNLSPSLPELPGNAAMTAKNIRKERSCKISLRSCSRWSLRSA